MTGSSALAIASPTSVPGWCVPAATERPGGGDVVGEQDQLLRLEQPDQTREEERAGRVDGDAAAGEHFDETRLGGHDDEVAGEGEVHAHPGGDSVDGRDDRLLELEHRAD